MNGATVFLPSMSIHFHAFDGCPVVPPCLIIVSCGLVSFRFVVCREWGSVRGFGLSGKESKNAN